MSTYELLHVYLTAAFGQVVDRSRTDERGFTDVAGQVVMIATAVVAALVIAGVLWAKLRTGAEGVQTPGPASP